MNYYKRHLGDYARKTRHLSIIEHGVYTLLLDAYYDRERSISETEAIRFSGARTDEEISAVKNVLSEFFTEENGLFSQSHADEVIDDFHKRQKTNRKLGAIGGKRNAKRTGSESLSEKEANDKPSHKPLATNQERAKEEKILSSPSATDESKKAVSEKRAERLRQVTADAIAAYNATLAKPHGKLSAVVLLNAVREKQVKGCIEVAQQICQSEYGSTTVTPEFWKTYFGVCAADPFNNGTGPYTGDHAKWRPDFEYLTRPGTMTKVFERSISESSE